MRSGSVPLGSMTSRFTRATWRYGSDLSSENNVTSDHFVHRRCSKDTSGAQGMAIAGKRQ